MRLRLAERGREKLSVSGREISRYDDRESPTCERVIREREREQDWKNRRKREGKREFEWL